MLACGRMKVRGTLHISKQHLASGEAFALHWSKVSSSVCDFHHLGAVRRIPETVLEAAQCPAHPGMGDRMLTLSLMGGRAHDAPFGARLIGPLFYNLY